jgi:hypothetical protein
VCTYAIEFIDGKRKGFGAYKEGSTGFQEQLIKKVFLTDQSGCRRKALILRA